MILTNSTIVATIDKILDQTEKSILSDISSELSNSYQKLDDSVSKLEAEYDKIIAKILAVSKNRTDTRIYVRGDKTINYGRVLEIMGLLSGSGFTKVALISEPLKQR